jgi:hypothetical protein
VTNGAGNFPFPFLCPVFCLIRQGINTTRDQKLGTIHKTTTPHTTHHQNCIHHIPTANRLQNHLIPFLFLGYYIVLTREQSKYHLSSSSP